MLATVGALDGTCVDLAEGTLAELLQVETLRGAFPF
jgi:hypothetical protein